MYNKMARNTYLSTINLNADELCALVERHRLTEWLTKTIYKTLTSNRMTQSRSKGVKKHIFCKWK